jgi:hypothetical protein
MADLINGLSSAVLENLGSPSPLVLAAYVLMEVRCPPVRDRNASSGPK